MFTDDTRTKLENIIRGALLEGEEGAGTAVRNFLYGRFKTGAKVKADFQGQLRRKKIQSVTADFNFERSEKSSP